MSCGALARGLGRTTSRGLLVLDVWNPGEQNDGDSPRNGVGGREGAGAQASAGEKGPSFSANLCLILGSSLQGSWVFSELPNLGGRDT